MAGAVLCFTVWGLLMPFALKVNPHCSNSTVLLVTVFGIARVLFGSLKSFISCLDFH